MFAISVSISERASFFNIPTVFGKALLLYSSLLDTFSFDDVASFESKPDITLNVLTISSIFLDKIPIVSNEDACATKPYLETLPYVGFSPVSYTHLRAHET